MKVSDNNFSNEKKDNVNNLITNETVLQFANKNKDYLKFVCEMSNKFWRDFKLLTPTFYGTNFYNLYLQDKGKAIDFFEKLSTGIGLHKDDALWLFRKKLIDAKIGDMKVKSRAKYFYLYYCWEKYLSGEKIKKLPGMPSEREKIAQLKNIQ